MNIFALGFRNAFRNTVRAGSIIAILGLSIGLCLVMLIAYQAVGRKISDIKSSIGNTITISPAGFNNFSEANNTLTSDALTKVASLAHVTHLSETLTDRLTTTGSSQPSFGKFAGSSTDTNAQTSLKSPVTINTNNGQGSGPRIFINGGGSLPTNFSLPIPIVGTTDPTSLDNNDATLRSGQTLSGTKDSNEALVSTSMASKNNLKVGSTFTAYGETISVVGIFDTGNQTANSTIVVSLPTLQRLTGQSGDVTNAVATVDSLDDLAGVTSAIKNTLGSSADIQSSQDEADATIQPLRNVESISLVSLIGAIAAGSIIILLTMVMIVRERRREIGILKAIGASNSWVVTQFISEALTLTLAGAVVGILIGIAGGNPVTNTLVSSNLSADSGSTLSAGSQTTFRRGGGFGQRAFSTRSVAGNFIQRGGNSLFNSVSNVSANIGWNVIAYGLIAAIFIAAIGSSLAGLLIARVRPSEVMRAE